MRTRENRQKCLGIFLNLKILSTCEMYSHFSSCFLHVSVVLKWKVGSSKSLMCFAKECNERIKHDELTENVNKTNEF